MGSGGTELGAAGPIRGPPIPWATTSTLPLGAGSVPKAELLPTCCFLPSAAGPLVTPMRWSMTCTRCSKEPGSSPSLFSSCLFCGTDTALPGARHHRSTPSTPPPACGAPSPSLAPGRGRRSHNPAGMSPAVALVSPSGACLTPLPAQQQPPAEPSGGGGSGGWVAALTLSCRTPSASSSSPGSSMSDWDLPSREYLGRILRAESGVWQCSGSAGGSAASPPSSDLLSGLTASPALLGARKMSLSIERLLLGTAGPLSGSFSHLEPRLDLGFLKAKKFPIFFLRVREPEGARGAGAEQVSGAMGLGREEALAKVSSRLPRGLESFFPPQREGSRWQMLHLRGCCPSKGTHSQCGTPWVLSHCLPATGQTPQPLPGLVGVGCCHPSPLAPALPAVVPLGVTLSPAPLWLGDQQRGRAGKGRVVARTPGTARARVLGGCRALGLQQLLCDEPLGKEVLQPLVHAGDAPVLAVLAGHGLHLRESLA